jgi:FKBP-type peptidyl-prolyl cis-trans isomerase
VAVIATALEEEEEEEEEEDKDDGENVKSMSSSNLHIQILPSNVEIQILGMSSGRRNP